MQKLINKLNSAVSENNGSHLDWKISPSYFVKLCFRHMPKSIYNEIGLKEFGKLPNLAFKQLGNEAFDDRMSSCLQLYLYDKFPNWDDINANTKSNNLISH